MTHEPLSQPSRPQELSPSELRGSDELIGPRVPQIRSGFDHALLRSVLGHSESRFNVVYTPTIDSTMNLCPFFEARSEPIVPGLVLAAGRQTHGVGRHGTWISSAESKDLTFSVVLPDTTCPRTHLLTHIAATLAVAWALEDLARLNPREDGRRPVFRVKLPNDVRVDDGAHYGKICGTLGVGALNADIKREHAAFGWRYPHDTLVMGVGINISNDVLSRAADLRYPVSSLERVTGRLYPREVVLGAVLRELDRMLDYLTHDQGALCRAANNYLALGEDRSAILDTHSGFSGPVKVREFTPRTLTYLSDDSYGETPLSDVRRLFPIEPENGEASL